jgi:hypothetical protein
MPSLSVGESAWAFAMHMGQLDEMQFHRTLFRRAKLRLSKIQRTGKKGTVDIFC